VVRTLLVRNVPVRMIDSRASLIGACHPPPTAEELIVALPFAADAGRGHFAAKTLRTAGCPAVRTGIFCLVPEPKRRAAVR
jgi:hypothetical protein